MSSIEILIIVDTAGAAADGLSDNVYLVDTNKHMGSGGEGQDELYTVCFENQTLNWRVESISPDGDVNIVQFTGTMIDQKWCQPQKEGISDGVYWSGTVQSQGNTDPQVQYSVVLEVNGVNMTFDPFLNVVAQP